jgi:hypothetical protein
MIQLRNYKARAQEHEQSSERTEQAVLGSMQGDIAQYANMNKDQLMQQLLSIVQKQKDSGNFDKDRLQSLVDTMSMMMSDDQKSRVQKVVDAL